jgi:hypothetical protein
MESHLSQVSRGTAAAKSPASQLLTPLLSLLFSVGHPFDTIKTKMQAQSGFLEGGGTLQALSKIWRAEGIRGLYRQILTAMRHDDMKSSRILLSNS